MEAFFFWLFAIGMIAGAVGVIANRSPVASALCLVLTFVFQAALFVMLQAFFLAAVQILVYAGAVMVLFLFIIMLLDLKAEENQPIRWFAWGSGVALGLVFVGIFAKVLHGVPNGNVTAASLPPPLRNTDGSIVQDVTSIGTLLFTKYTLPFEVTGILLLVATIGVVLLSKRSNT